MPCAGQHLAHINLLLQVLLFGPAVSACQARGVSELSLCKSHCEISATLPHSLHAEEPCESKSC